MDSIKHGSSQIKVYTTNSHGHVQHEGNSTLIQQLLTSIFESNKMVPYVGLQKINKNK